MGSADEGLAHFGAKAERFNLAQQRRAGDVGGGAIDWMRRSIAKDARKALLRGRRIELIGGVRAANGRRCENAPRSHQDSEEQD